METRKTPTSAVPVVVESDGSWTCARCGGVIDETRSVWIRARPGQPTKITHSQCPPLPRCIAAMGCLCAFHARGGAAGDACDASE